MESSDTIMYAFKKEKKNLQPVSIDANNNPCEDCFSLAAFCNNCIAKDRCTLSGCITGDSNGGGFNGINGVIRWTTIANCGSATSKTFNGGLPLLPIAPPDVIDKLLFVLPFGSGS